MKWFNDNIPDKFWVGFVAGLLIPWLAFACYWRTAFPQITFVHCAQVVYNGSYYTQLMSLCVIPICFVLYGVLELPKNRVGYGLLGAMILYAAVNMLLKFI